MTRQITLNPARFTDADLRAMVEQLAFLADNDPSVTESLDLHQGSFTLRVKLLDGSKPGVQEMDKLAAIYRESPFKLMQLLMKLFDVTCMDDIRDLETEISDQP